MHTVIKTCLRFGIILLLACVLVACFPVNSISQGEWRTRKSLDVPAQVFLNTTPPIALKLTREGKDKNPHYYFIGVVVFCDTIFSVQALTIYSATDSTHLRAILVNHTFSMADSCTVEQFTFGIHGGALRKQLEKDGECAVIVHGAMKSIILEPTPDGEQMLMNIILK